MVLVRQEIGDVLRDFRLQKGRTLRQVASNTERIGQGERKDIDQDRRLDALERTVKTP